MSCKKCNNCGGSLDMIDESIDLCIYCLNTKVYKAKFLKDFGTYKIVSLSDGSVVFTGSTSECNDFINGCGQLTKQNLKIQS